MKRGSTLNFKKESAAFARALHQEHVALGTLLDEIAAGGATIATLTLARDSYNAVRFQRSRTEAARGR